MEPTKDPIELLKRLYDYLGRRQDEYFKVMGEASDPETRASFAARHSEVTSFMTDIEMLLERVEV